MYKVQSVAEGSQGRNPEAGIVAEPVEQATWLKDRIPELAWSAFLRTTCQGWWYHSQWAWPLLIN